MDRAHQPTRPLLSGLLTKTRQVGGNKLVLPVAMHALPAVHQQFEGCICLL